MFWSFCSSSHSLSDLLMGDIPYIGSLILLAFGLWRNFRNKENSWLLVLIGGLMTMQSFLVRVIMILQMRYGNENADKTIAFARSVLHTLVVPLIIVVVWSVFRLIREHYAGKRKWWQTGLWLVWIVFAAWWCIGGIHYIYKYFGTYSGASPFP